MLILKLVLVYLGEEVPAYVFENINYLKSTFTNNQIVFLSDSNRALEKASKMGAEVFKSAIGDWSKFQEIVGYSSSFRDGFWFKTVARFYAIFEYMKTCPNDEILHIEADVWLSPRFPIKKISGIEELLAYPLANESEGVASTLFIKSLEGARLLVSFSEERFLADSKATDVSILGSLYRTFPSKILILPTMSSPDFGFNNDVPMRVKLVMSKNFQTFGGLFDASTWGQFLTGEDPRNDLGKKRIFHHQKHHAVNPAEYTFAWSKESGLNLVNTFSCQELFSLHIHSKDIDFFTIANFSRALAIRCTQKELGERVEVNLGMFMASLPGYLRYRFRLWARKFFYEFFKK